MNIVRACSVKGCYNEATVVGVRWHDDEPISRGPEVAWCDDHAVEAVRQHRGKVWADAQCDCGRTHDILDRAGRRAEGSV